MTGAEATPYWLSACWAWPEVRATVEANSTREACKNTHTHVCTINEDVQKKWYLYYRYRLLILRITWLRH